MTEHELTRWAERVCELLDEAAQHRRDPIDLNYVAIPKDTWKLLQGNLARYRNETDMREPDGYRIDGGRVIPTDR